MLRRTCRATGLALTLDLDPEPRNPRLAEDSLFHLVTWTEPRLGDAHDWPSPSHFLAAMRHVPALVVPVKVVRSRDGRPGFSTVGLEGRRPAGYAVATHERLRLHFGADALTPEHLEDARLACDGELLAYEQFLEGDVHAYTIAAPDGRVLERRDGLCGVEWAEWNAERAFEDRVMRWGRDEGRRRPAA